MASALHSLRTARRVAKGKRAKASKRAVTIDFEDTLVRPTPKSICSKSYVSSLF
jgi:hypothetical protein